MPAAAVAVVAALAFWLAESTGPRTGAQAPEEARSASGAAERGTAGAPAEAGTAADDATQTAEAAVDGGEALEAAPMFPGDGVLVVSVTQGGAPLAGAAVRLSFLDLGSVPLPWRAAGRGTTGPEGKVQFDARPGMYAVDVRAKGARATVVTITDEQAGESQRVEVDLGAPSPIRGTVRAKQGGAPIAGALVIAGPVLEGMSVPDEAVEQARTDAAGRFELESRVAEGLRVRATAAGYLSEHVDLEEAGAVGPLELSLAALPRRAGHVRTPAGEAVEGATVVASGCGRPEGVATARDGSFSIACPPGEFPVGAHKADAASPNHVVLFTADGTPEPLELVLHPAGSIRGRVQRAGGAGVPGAKVAARPVQADWRRSARWYRGTADGEGRFALRSMPGGRYVVVAQAGVQCAPELVTVVPGQEAELEVSLPLDGSVEGEVVDLQGKPSARAVVQLAVDPPRLQANNDEEAALMECRGFDAETRSDERGAFRFEHAPPGNAYVFARLPHLDQGESQAVAVEAGKVARVKLALGGEGTLRGVVKNKTGGPLPPEVVVTVGDSAGGARTLPVDGRGAFSLKLAAGDYLVAAGNTAADFFPGHGGPLHRVEGGKVTEVELEYDPATARTQWSLKGRVVDAAGNPAVAEGMYLLFRGGGRGFRTDREGRFEVSDDLDELPQSVTLTARTETTSSEPLVVTDYSQEVTVRLRPARRISGRVRDDSGRSVEQFALVLELAKNHTDSWRAPRPFSGDTFAFDMPPVEAELLATLPDGRVGVALIPASARAETVLVRVFPPGSIRFRVVEAGSRKPVAGLSVRAMRDDRNEEARATTGPDGAGLLPSLRAGAYEVQFFGDFHLPDKVLTLKSGETVDLGVLEARPMRRGPLEP